MIIASFRFIVLVNHISVRRLLEWALLGLFALKIPVVKNSCTNLRRYQYVFEHIKTQLKELKVAHTEVCSE